MNFSKWAFKLLHNPGFFRSFNFEPCFPIVKKTEICKAILQAVKDNAINLLYKLQPVASCLLIIDVGHTALTQHYINPLNVIKSSENKISYYLLSYNNRFVAEQSRMSKANFKTHLAIFFIFALLQSVGLAIFSSFANINQSRINATLSLVETSAEETETEFNEHGIMPDKMAFVSPLNYSVELQRISKAIYSPFHPSVPLPPPEFLA